MGKILERFRVGGLCTTSSKFFFLSGWLGAWWLKIWTRTWKIIVGRSWQGAKLAWGHDDLLCVLTDKQNSTLCAGKGCCMPSDMQQREFAQERRWWAEFRRRKFQAKNSSLWYGGGYCSRGWGEKERSCLEFRKWRAPLGCKRKQDGVGDAANVSGYNGAGASSTLDLLFWKNERREADLLQEKKKKERNFTWWGYVSWGKCEQRCYNLLFDENEERKLGRKKLLHEGYYLKRKEFFWLQKNLEYKEKEMWLWLGFQRILPWLWWRRWSSRCAAQATSEEVPVSLAVEPEVALMLWQNWCLILW